MTTSDTANTEPQAPSQTDVSASVDQGAGAAERPARRGGAGRAFASFLIGLVQFTFVVAFIGSGLFAAWWFKQPLESPDQDWSRPEVARPVSVERVTRTDSPVEVRALGTVTPARQVMIRPRVSGTVIEEGGAFVPGGFFAAGDTMLRLDREDYERVLEQRMTEVERAEAALQIELGDQAVAREELELLGVDIPAINRDLILRIPQVNRARADLRSAEAAVARAQLDLDRTEIFAPFAGQLVERSVTLGSSVGVGDSLGMLVGTDRFWIELALPVSSLRWIEFAEDGDDTSAGSPVTIAYAAAWGPGVTREGRVTRLIGRLEDGSRLARVLVVVEDPLSLDTGGAGEGGPPPLILGATVEVVVSGRELANVFVVDRATVRDEENGGEIVWVMDEEDRLRTEPVEVMHAGPRVAYIAGELRTGDRIVRTNLTTPVDGMLLREVVDPSASPEFATKQDEDAADG